MHLRPHSFVRILPLAVLAAALLVAQRRGERPAPTPGPMLTAGTMEFETPDFRLKLVRSSQTVAALEPKSAPGFDFTPADLLVERSQNGYYHLGDLDLRVRKASAGPWTDYSTAQSRTPVTELASTGAVLASADLAPTLPADIPLKITRSWLLDRGALVLRFEISNRTSEPVQVGALGLPMVFNNVLTGRSLDQAHAVCSFSDPYIGADAGYLQVTRLSGHGPALLVLPDGRTPFEAYNPIAQAPRGNQGGTRGGSAPLAMPRIFTDPTPRSNTFEGFFDWMVHSRAWAENEWKNAAPWNPPTMQALAPGESRTYGLRFVLSTGIREIESTLASAGRPVALGIPGYILPEDVEARLFLRYGRTVTSLAVEPRGAITVTDAPAAPEGWSAYNVRGKTWGRARLLVRYEDGTEQAIHYMVTKTESEAVRDLGRFLTTSQWFVDPDDPFKRSPSVMTYDRDENRIVTQDTRAWVAGLGDEGGSIWLAGAMKLLGQPDKGQVEKYETFISKVLWGGLQYSDGPRKFGVRKSLFYYQPDQMPPDYYRPGWNWTTWTSWNKAATEAVDRSYDYPHVAALHWVMYRLARNQSGLVTSRPLGMVSHQRLRDVGGDDHPGAPLRAVWPDGRHGLSRDPARFAARGMEGAGVGSRGPDEEAGRGLEPAGLPVRQRDALGFDRAGRGLRVDEILR